MKTATYKLKKFKRNSFEFISSICFKWSCLHKEPNVTRPKMKKKIENWDMNGIFHSKKEWRNRETKDKLKIHGTALIHTQHIRTVLVLNVSRHKLIRLSLLLRFHFPRTKMKRDSFEIFASLYLRSSLLPSFGSLLSAHVCVIND